METPSQAEQRYHGPATTNESVAKMPEGKKVGPPCGVRVGVDR